MSNPFLHTPAQREKSAFGEVIQALIVALVINVIIYFLFIIPSQVDGPSMQPNLMDKQLLLANKTPTWLYSHKDILQQLGWDYNYGDIVIFDFDNIVLVKRVIAKGGDRVKITSDGDVYLNGKLLQENFLRPDTKTYLPQAGLSLFAPDTEVTVPADQFFLMGDNRVNSKDSRFSDVGFVKRDAIRGVVFFRFWPFDKFGPISKLNYN